MLGGIRDSESDDDNVEKARIVEHGAPRREVIPDVKLELPFARRERIALEERRITAAIVVGRDLLNSAARRAGEQGELKRHAGRRQTASEVENVCRQAAHTGDHGSSALQFMRAGCLRKRRASRDANK